MKLREPCAGQDKKSCPHLQFGHVDRPATHYRPWRFDFGRPVSGKELHFLAIAQVRAMGHLDSIFASYPTEGFQDVWFSAFEPNDVARLFNYACQTYGKAAPRAIWVQPTDRELGIYFGESALRDVHYEFTPLVVGNTVLECVVIRIEDDRLAIDFNSGLEYWNSTRQTAFVHWLRELHRQVPNARLEWAHEGCADSPSERESVLLRLAVVGDA